MQTENKTLVESSNDDVWGMGIPLSSQDCLISSKWKSVRILGHILMKIRDMQMESDTTKMTETEPESTN